MKILVFSDIHGDARALHRLVEIEADYYFAAGDMGNWSRGLDAMGEILALRAERTYVLPGNHESEEDIAGMCERFGMSPFHGQVLDAGGVSIAGLGYSTPTPFGTPGEYSETEMAHRLDAFRDLRPLVLVCHAPPYGTALDQMRGGEHSGSHSVRAFIDANQPAAFFCGHIHESQGRMDTIGRTKAWNVGKQGVLFDFDTLEP